MAPALAKFVFSDWQSLLIYPIYFDRCLSLLAAFYRRVGQHFLTARGSLSAEILSSRLAADYQRLEFLRIIRDHGTRRVRQLPGLVIPEDDGPETVAPNDGSIDG